MTEPEQRVLDMVASRKISATEGEQLLTALQKQTPSGPPFLLSPFARLSGVQALVASLVVVVVTMALPHFDHRFDGALDLHSMLSLERPWFHGAVDLVATVLITGTIAWAIAWILGRRGRLVDMYGAVLVSRVPYAIAALLSVVAGMLSLHWVVAVALALAGLGWFLLLLFYGLAHASGLRGVRLVLLFALTVVISEVASKAMLAAVG